jgi:hypothetical protein|nr:MAG TPA: Protein of unknown function (DUF1372) [Caudoviricetes sp.]
MSKAKKFAKFVTVLSLIVLLFGLAIIIPRVTRRQYRTVISNFMDEDDVENAIHVFYTVRDNLNINGKVTAKIKKRTDISLISEYIGEKNLIDQRYTVYRYLVQVDVNDNIIVDEKQFQSIKIGDNIKFQRDDDREILYINDVLYSNEKE